MIERKVIVAVFVAISALTFKACTDERSLVHDSPLYGGTSPRAQQIELVPGLPRSRPAFDPEFFDASEAVLVEGKRLYGWYNCAGCHFNGGGGIGPPLMNNEWIYGGEPHVIADSIINGRPQGMPAYGDRIPAAHVGPIVAYVRSLSGLGSAAPPTPTPYERKKPPPGESGGSKEGPGVEEIRQQ